MKFKLNKKVTKRVAMVFAAIFLVWYYFSVPNQPFNASYSTVLLDKDNTLLAARISKDQQWRFRSLDSIPVKFRKCIVEFEDRSFETHLGVSIRGLARAVKQNFSSSSRVSGASTISMQVIRLSRNNPSRTYVEKVGEIFRATRLELSYSKDEILKMYCTHAPFGGNVVGLSAASWRYFGCSADKLSWAESATLAVLPNAPGLIFPGRNRELLIAKRNRLLKRLYDKGDISKDVYDLALLEPIPDKPKRLANDAPHLMDEMINKGFKGQTIKTSLQGNFQNDIDRRLSARMQELNANGVHNVAVLVTSVKTGQIVAYIGNDSNASTEHSNAVNCVLGKRSTGSILKPILYSQALHAGVITPNALLFDVPSNFSGFTPKNFNGNYSGLVSASQSLSKSLNIPMIYLLQNYGQKKFYEDLKGLGFSTFNQPAKHYGLSLILGGAEVTLKDLNQVYTNMAQKLANVTMTGITCVADNQKEINNQILEEACIYETFEAMVEVKRPSINNGWKQFSSSQKIAWKTGTSFGFRDAWSVGITKDYVVSVWVGNADGEGRPGLTGIQCAAPILFDIFELLPNSGTWFKKPIDNFQTVELCEKSGALASRFCDQIITEDLPFSCLESAVCQFHKPLHLNKEKTHQVNSSCYPVADIQTLSWFLLPPTVIKYYEVNHPEYVSPPEFLKGCNENQQAHFSVVYPKNNQRIILPKNFENQKQKLVLEAATVNQSSILYWHLDGVYLGTTERIHQLELTVKDGEHTLTIVNSSGNEKQVKFTTESV